jgi:hypothetical protein
MAFRTRFIQFLVVTGCFFCSVHAGISQNLQGAGNSAVEFKVFPNPNHGEEAFVSLKGFQAEDLLVVVYDMLGREIFSRIAVSENNGFLFSLSSEGHVLHPGVYLIVASKNDAVFRQKLIVRS